MCHRYQIRICQRRQLRKAIKTAVETFKDTGIAHGVERAAMDALLQRLAGSENAA